MRANGDYFITEKIAFVLVRLCSHFLVLKTLIKTF